MKKYAIQSALAFNICTSQKINANYIKSRQIFFDQKERCAYDGMRVRLAECEKNVKKLQSVRHLRYRPCNIKIIKHYDLPSNIREVSVTKMNRMKPQDAAIQRDLLRLWKATGDTTRMARDREMSTQVAITSKALVLDEEMLNFGFMIYNIYICIY